MISIGECAFITIGMPGARQVLVALVPCPPARWSSRLALKIASYSGVNGASCVVPQRLAGSKENTPLCVTLITAAIERPITALRLSIEILPLILLWLEVAHIRRRLIF